MHERMNFIGILKTRLHFENSSHSQNSKLSTRMETTLEVPDYFYIMVAQCVMKDLIALLPTQFVIFSGTLTLALHGARERSGVDKAITV